MVKYLKTSSKRLSEGGIVLKRFFNPKLMLIASMTTFGTIGLFVKNIPLSSSEIALYRAILASLLIYAFLLIKRERFCWNDVKKEIPILFISGAAIGFNWILLFEAYKYTTVSIATLSYYFAPVIVTLVCPILFKEKMGAKQWLCFAMSTLGIALITGFDISSGGNHFIGILLGLSAACLYASVILLNKYIKKTGDIHRTLLQFLATSVVLTPYVLLTDGINITSLNLKGWIFLLAVGLIHTGITYCMYFSSLKSLTGQQTAILSYIDPLVAVLISVFILKESITPVQILGGILILGFTLYNEIPSRKK